MLFSLCLRQHKDKLQFFAFCCFIAAKLFVCVISVIMWLFALFLCFEILINCTICTNFYYFLLLSQVGVILGCVYILTLFSPYIGYFILLALFAILTVFFIYLKM